MSVIEECYEAAYEAARSWYPDKPNWAEIKKDTFSSRDCAEHYRVMVNAVVKTLAGKLDEGALQAALAPNGFLPERETRKAIQCYLNQLINEEKE